MSEIPLVTAFTLIYNNGTYTIDSLDCIRNNSYKNIEHIIIDDGSTDNISINLIENYILKYNYDCTFIKHKKNLGICKSLNEILEISKGKYLFGLSDDLIIENKIQDDINLFETLDEKYAVMHSMLQYINFDGTIKYPYIYPNLPYPETISSDYSLNEIINKGGLIATPTAMFRKKSIELVGGWDEDIKYEDTQMWLKLTKNNFKFYFRPDLTTYYRRSNSQLTNIPAFERKDFLINEIKLYAPYLKYSAAKKIIFLDFLFSVIKNKTNDLDNALEIYNSKKNRSKLIYLLFRYRFWALPVRFILVVFNKIKKLLKFVNNLIINFLIT